MLGQGTNKYKSQNYSFQRGGDIADMLSAKVGASHVINEMHYQHYPAFSSFEVNTASSSSCHW